MMSIAHDASTAVSDCVKKKNKSELSATSVRLEPELHRSVKRALIDRGGSLTSAIQDGLRLWLGEAGRISPVEPLRQTPDTAPRVSFSTIAPSDPRSEWLSLLDQILSSGHAIAIQAITHNLRAFAALVDVDRGAHDDYPVPNPEDLDKEIERILASGRDDPPRGEATPKRDRKRRPA